MTIVLFCSRFLNPIELRNAMKVLGFKVSRDEVKDMSSECTKRG
jgi:Ca2+-binding EF-hand superfamily protein